MYELLLFDEPINKVSFESGNFPKAQKIGLVTGAKMYYTKKLNLKNKARYDMKVRDAVIMFLSESIFYFSPR